MFKPIVMTSQLQRTKLVVATANSIPAPAQALAQTLQANEWCSCDVGAKVSFRFTGPCGHRWPV